MYEDEVEQGQPRRGRAALIAAWLIVALGLGGAFGYVVFVPADTADLAAYGQVSVPLRPPQADRGETTASAEPGASRSTATATTSTTKPTTGAAGAAANGGTASNEAAPKSDGGESGASSTGITGESVTANGGTDGTARPDDTSVQSGTAQSGRSDNADETATAGGDTAGTVANPPETRKTSRSGGDGTADGGTSSSEAVTGESAVTTNAPPPQWKQYARVLSPPEGVDRIAVVVRGLGLSSAATEAAIERLPGEISLSFSPYARRAIEWTLRARARGHEVLMDLPMEPRSYPANDPGPRALMTTKPTPQNLENLKWILGKGRELVGVVGQMGSAFVKNKRAVSPILRHLKQRGLIYVDNGNVPGNAGITAAQELALPVAVNTRTLDDGQISRPAIRGRLVAAEREAKQSGQAVVMAHPYPVTIDLLQEWSRNLGQRGLALVPISNIVRSPDRTEAAQLR